MVVYFCFKQKTAYELRISDWSSDVCSSDLEDSGEITALLDWELARIGDFHEDLGWVLMQIFGAFDGDGAFRASDLFEREEFIIEYERRSGRTVNRRTLHYYDVMASWKCNVIVVANGQIGRASCRERVCQYV